MHDTYQADYNTITKTCISTCERRLSDQHCGLTAEGRGFESRPSSRLCGGRSPCDSVGFLQVLWFLPFFRCEKEKNVISRFKMRLKSGKLSVKVFLSMIF